MTYRSGYYIAQDTQANQIKIKILDENRLFKEGAVAELATSLASGFKVGVSAPLGESFAIMKWNDSQELMTDLYHKDVEIKRLETQVEDLQSQMEDILLGIHSKEAIEKVERGENEEYVVKNLSEVFQLIKQ